MHTSSTCRPHALGAGSPSAGVAVEVAQYKIVGGWYWQTSGVELGSQTAGTWGRGTLRHSFIHNNDDALILWHSNNSVSDVVIWGGTNGANIQLGWVPRELVHVMVEDVDVIHNLQGWADAKTNNCVVNAAGLIPGFSVDAHKTLRDVVLRGITSEGQTLCAVRLAVEMRYLGLTLQDLAVDAWNGLGAAAQESTFHQADTAVFIAPAARVGLLLRNYTVGNDLITLAADNWQSNKRGRLNFAADMWGYWSAVP